MKKRILSIICLALTTIAIAQVQIPFPTDVQFEAYLKREIPNLEKSTGVTLIGLKRNTTGKVIEFRYPETSGYNYKAWPKDGCQKEYFYIVPEQKSGIGGYVQVNVNYRRSKCEGDDCSLTNKWEEKSVLGAFGYSRTKAITKTEADSMAMRCVRYEKDSLLANVIKITKIEPSKGILYNDVPSYYSRLVSFNELEFSVDVSCEVAVFAIDYSLLISKQVLEKQLYFIMKFDGKNWVPVRRTNNKEVSNDESYFLDEEKMNSNKYYTPLCKSSLSSIYNKYNESKPTGETILTKLQKRIKSVEDVLLAKDENLKLADLSPFLYKKEIKDLEVKTQEWISRINTSYSITKFITLKTSKVKHLENTELRNDNGHIVEGSFVLKAQSQSFFEAEVGMKKLKQLKEEVINLDWVYNNGEWYISSVPNY